MSQSNQPEILWTSNQTPRDQTPSVPRHDYRIVCYDRDTWYARARRVSVMTLERREYTTGSGERWGQVGVRVDFLRFPPRTGRSGDDVCIFHSMKTGIAFLKGWAAAVEH